MSLGPKEESQVRMAFEAALQQIIDTRIGLAAVDADLPSGTLRVTLAWIDDNKDTEE